MEDYINTIILVESQNNTWYTHCTCTYNLEYSNGTRTWGHSLHLLVFKIKIRSELTKEWG